MRKLIVIWRVVEHIVVVAVVARAAEDAAVERGIKAAVARITEAVEEEVFEEVVETIKVAVVVQIITTTSSSRTYIKLIQLVLHLLTRKQRKRMLLWQKSINKLSTVLCALR